MKKIWIPGSIVFLTLLIVIGFLLIQANQPAAIVEAQGKDVPGKRQKVIEIAVESNIDGEVKSGEVTLTFDDPAALPSERESALGVYLAKNGDVVTIGTGSIAVEISSKTINDEEPITTVNVSHSGDSIDVQVGPDTLVYRDITAMPEVSPADLETGTKVITRTIEPGSFDEIGEGMILRIWGEIQDGRVLADVLVYEEIQ